MIGVFLESIMMLIWSLIEIKYLSFTLILFWGLLVFTRVPSQLNYLSYSVKTEYMSRIHSLMDMSFVIPNIAVAVFVSIIGNRVVTQNQLILFAIVFIIFTWGRIKTNQMREIWNGPKVKIKREEQNEI